MMHERSVFEWTLRGWLALSAVTFVVLFFVAAPYGKHERKGWGPAITPRWGWLLMEGPAALVLPALAVPALLANGWPLGWLLVVLWAVHYVQRGFVYPFRIRSRRPMPLAVVGLGVLFNLVNGWLVARGLTVFGPELGRAALTSPRVVAGVALFVLGLVVNWDSDRRLFRLPREEGRYAIPQGGLFELVTSPNYLGELVEWLGFALAAGSLAAASFFVWTFANLAPRAVAHHRWYRRELPGYPEQRKALIPWVW